MTQDTNRDTLQNWWETITFPGKELYKLSEQGELVLKKALDDTERVITNLAAGNADVLLKALTDKYDEAAARMQEIEKEWADTAEKMKLAGKVERMQDYLKHANLAGNMDLMFGRLREWNEELKKQSLAHFELKKQLLLQAEELSAKENFKEATQAFKDLVEQWKKTGLLLDKHKGEELNNKFEALRKDFFDRKRKFIEDQEKDMLQNLDLKLEMVDKAEKLAASDSWKDTSEAFRVLMEQWKATGRTMHEKNEALWQRFITAKNIFFDRKKEHSDQIHKEHAKNFDIKSAIVDQANALKESTDWTAATEAFSGLMDQWRAAGRLAAEKGDELWDKFNAAKDHFFNAKRTHFEARRLEMEDNYAQKMAILKRAESLRNSRNWRDATNELNELMDEWKKIGPVMREQSQAMWEQFLAARKQFFNRKDAMREERKGEMEKQKGERVQQVREFKRKLEEELKDIDDEVVDFKNGLENITPGMKKEQELRQHLTNLINESDGRKEQKRKKLEEVTQQLEELEKKLAEEKNTAPEKPAAE